MRQVDNTLAVLVVAKLLKQYDDCNPDVGMGPSNDWFVAEALNRLALTAGDVNVPKILDGMARR